jgi:hypothetical protein
MRLWCICCELTDPTVGECLGVESGQNVEELRPQFEEVIATLSKADELYAEFLRTHDVLALSLDENRLAERMRDELPDVQEVIADLGDSCRISTTTWLVATDLTATEMWERLWPLVIAKNERVVILPIASASEWRLHSGSVDDNVSAWMGRYLNADLPSRGVHRGR